MTEEEKRTTWETYEKFAEEYALRDTQTIPVTADTLAAIAAFSAQLHEGASILDVGSGAGRDAQELTGRGFVVTGIDSSPAMVRVATGLYPKIHFQQADVGLRLPFESGHFDGVWANASLHHVGKESFQAILGELFRVMQAGGKLFIRLRHGSGEGMTTEDRFNSRIQRFFANYMPDEARDLLSGTGFQGISCRVVTEGKWLDIMAVR